MALSLSSWLHLESIRTDAVLPLVYVAASAAVKLFVSYNSGGVTSVPRRAQCVGHVTRLNVYPVKSMDGIHVEEALCTYTGLKLTDTDLYDRRYMLTVGDEYRFVTARQCPTLLLVKTSVDNGEMCFDAPGMERLRVPVIHEIGSEHDCKLTKVCGGQEVTGWDCGQKPAEWFTRFLNVSGGSDKYHLLFNPGIGLRNIDRRPHLYVNWAKPEDYQDYDYVEDRSQFKTAQTCDSGLQRLVFPGGHPINYHDDGPYLLVTESSLAELNQRVTSATSGALPVTFDYFRPAIEVGGFDIPPFDEDTWNEVYIGDVKYTVILPCGRCVMTTVDPYTAQVRKDGEPLKTLRTFRMIQSNNASPCFGSIMVCDRPGKIRVGDNVYVLRRRTD